MNGVQFYLRHDVPVVQGHVIYIDSPWSLTSISQQQFWRDNIARDYGNGSVGGILSVDVSNWDARGMLFGKTARDCTRDQIKQEVWAQLKAHLNVGGATVLADANLVDWNLDRDIKEHGCTSGRHTTECIDLEPLLINTKGSWQYRPEAATRIANFVPGVRLRAHLHRSGDDGRRQRGRAPRRERDTRRVGLQRVARVSCGPCKSPRSLPRCVKSIGSSMRRRPAIRSTRR